MESQKRIKYRSSSSGASSSSNTSDAKPIRLGFQDSFKVDADALSRGTNFLNFNQLITPSPRELPWLTSIHVENGMKRAVEETFQGIPNPLVSAQFVGQLTWNDDGTQGPKTQIGKQLNNPKLFNLDKKFFFWFANKSKDPGQLQIQPNGSHWVVILIILPENILNLFDGSSKIKIMYFDACGDAMPRPMRTFVSNMFAENIPSVLYTYIHKLDPDTTVNFENVSWGQVFDDTLLRGHQRVLQIDSVQCGVWCIWWTHMICQCIHNNQIFDLLSFSYPPPQDDIPAHIAFRRLFFKNNRKRERHDDSH